MSYFNVNNMSGFGQIMNTPKKPLSGLDLALRLFDSLFQFATIQVHTIQDDEGMTYFVQPAGLITDRMLTRILFGMMTNEDGNEFPWPPPWTPPPADPRVWGWPLYITGQKPYSMLQILKANPYAQIQCPPFTPEQVGTTLPGFWPSVIKTRWNASRGIFEPLAE